MKYLSSTRYGNDFKNSWLPYRYWPLSWGIRHTGGAEPSLSLQSNWEAEHYEKGNVIANWRAMKKGTLPTWKCGWRLWLSSRGEGRPSPWCLTTHISRRQDLSTTLDSESSVFVLTAPMRFQSFFIAPVSYSGCTYSVDKVPCPRHVAVTGLL